MRSTPSAATAASTCPATRTQQDTVRASPAPSGGSGLLRTGQCLPVGLLAEGNGRLPGGSHGCQRTPRHHAARRDTAHPECLFTVRYPEQFLAETREVELEGKVSSGVTHDAAHPFVIKTSRMDVRVLGTRFNVKSYSTDEIIAVEVEEGKVQIDLPEAIDAPEGERTDGVQHLVQRVQQAADGARSRDLAERIPLL